MVYRTYLRYLYFFIKRRFIVKYLKKETQEQAHHLEPSNQNEDISRIRHLFGDVCWYLLVVYFYTNLTL